MGAKDEHPSQLLSRTNKVASKWLLSYGLYCRTGSEKMDSAVKTYKQGLFTTTKTKSLHIPVLPILYKT
jgi:hypothetical protein